MGGERERGASRGYFSFLSFPLIFPPPRKRWWKRKRIKGKEGRGKRAKGKMGKKGWGWKGERVKGEGVEGSR